MATIRLLCVPYSARLQHGHGLNTHTQPAPGTVCLIVEHAAVFFGEDAESTVALGELRARFLGRALESIPRFLHVRG